MCFYIIFISLNIGVSVIEVKSSNPRLLLWKTEFTHFNGNTCIIIILIIAGKRKHTANIYFIGAYLICCEETSHGCSKIFKEANIRVSIILLARVTIKMIL